MSEDCSFCGIVEGRLEASRVFEDPVSVAFLDRRPLFPGHCLLVPRAHVDTLTGLPAIEVEPLFQAVQLLCRAVECALGCQGTFVAINNRVSQSVPHLHVHVVPRNKGDGLRGFFWPRNAYQSPEHMRRVQEDLREAVRREINQSLKEGRLP